VAENTVRGTLEKIQTYIGSYGRITAELRGLSLCHVASDSYAYCSASPPESAPIYRLHPPTSGRSVAVRVVGHSTITGDPVYHAFLWAARADMIDLGAPAGASSFAVGLNQRGQVIGQIYLPPTQRAFFWSAGEGMVDLGTLGGTQSFESSATAASEEVIRLRIAHFRGVQRPAWWSSRISAEVWLRRPG
jgi:probable HAF family extracellular repeat protein